MEKLKRKIQKKKGDLKVRKTGFCLLTICCTALLCLGTTSYVKAEEGVTSKREQRRVEKKDGQMISGISKEEKEWLAAHPNVLRAVRKSMAKRHEKAKRAKKNKDASVGQKKEKTDRGKKLKSEKREKAINKRIEKLNAEIDALRKMLEAADSSEAPVYHKRGRNKK